VVKKDCVIFVLSILNNKVLKMRYRMISPDGFDFEVNRTYGSKKECKKVFEERVLPRYSHQGFYSSPVFKRINLEDLWSFTLLEPTTKYYIISVGNKFVTGINVHSFGLVSYNLNRTKAMRIREKDLDFVSTELLKQNLAHNIEETHYVPKKTLFKLKTK